MKRTRSIALCWLVLGITLTFVSSAAGDFLPSPAHAGLLGPHQNPFVPRWPVPPPFPPPLTGIVVPTPFYGTLGPLRTVAVRPGFDSVVNPGGWHWETELDVDPYGFLGAAVVPFFLYSA